ncbi:hypothetical protein JCM9957A_00170 [Kineosporia succinea]
MTVLATSTSTVTTGTWYTLSLHGLGSTISGSINGVSIGSAGNALASAGRIGLQTANATASFDDITVTTGTTSAPTTPASSNPATTTPAATTRPPRPRRHPDHRHPRQRCPLRLTHRQRHRRRHPGGPTTLATAITKVAAGGTIYLRGGTYALSATQTIAEGNDGTASAPKTIAAYPGESPVLDFSAQAVADSNRGLA